jgi:hypothetical protein
MAKHGFLFFLSLFIFGSSINSNAGVFNVESGDIAGPMLSEQKLAKLQIPFIANQGQRDKEVKFYARTFGGTVFVTESGTLVYSLPKIEGKTRVNGVVLREGLLGGRVDEVKGEDRATTKLNYFSGNDSSKWQRNIPSYDVVSLGEVYPGVEFKLKAYGNNVEKLFYVKPGAQPDIIKMQLAGANGLRVNEQGELEVETELGVVKFSKPVAYQEENDEKKEIVEAAYVVKDDKYGFEVGDYDNTRELVIDPILAATYLGGFGLTDDGGREFAIDIAVESTGNILVAGTTNASDFPGGIGASYADSTFDGEQEGFVAKLTSDLSTILAVTYLGGADSESALALALDSTNNVYVLGITRSSDFPGIGAGSADNTFTGHAKGFVSKLSSDLSTILAATFLAGGAGLDESFNDIALDGTGNIYVAGGSLETQKAFVLKLNSDLSSILASAFFPASFITSDSGRALALDPIGNVYVAGITEFSNFPGIGPASADSTFPVTWGYEGFVAKLSSDLSTVLAATFLGGSKGSVPETIAIDSAGNVFVAGLTRSSDFPGVGPGSADSSFAEVEAFIAKLNSDLSSIRAATFLGGSGQESSVANALALDTLGNVYVTGSAFSSDFPGISLGSADRTFAGTVEGFVTKLNSDLSAILAATFLGGSGTDEPRALALDNAGNVYVVGNIDTNGPMVVYDFPGIGPFSADSSFGGDQEGFVAKLDPNLSREPPVSQVVNDRVNFVVQSTSFNPNPVAGGPAGVFTINALLSNKSAEGIWEPIKVVVTTLSNGNKLLSATEGNGGVGSKQAIDAGSDDALTPNESVNVQLKIGLANRNRFSFFVNVEGGVLLSPE